MSTTASIPAHDPDEPGYWVADEVEAWLAVRAATAAEDGQEAEPQPSEERPQPRRRWWVRRDRPALPGYTRRVRALEAELAEADVTLDLLAQGDPRVHVPTAREQRARLRAAEALRLHRLSRTPELVAYQEQRVRRVVTVAVLLGVVVALGWSSLGVRDSVALALEIPRGTAGWWAALAVEPILSLPLMGAVLVQAYAAMRGAPVRRTSPEGRRLFKLEAALLGQVLILNIWPVLEALGLPREVLVLLVHALGPLGAVSAVWTLPTLWAVLAALPDPAPVAPGEGTEQDHAAARTGPEYSGNTVVAAPGGTGTGTPADTSALAARVAKIRALIAAGALPAAPGAHQIRRALGCGMDTARHVRDALRTHPTT